MLLVFFLLYVSGVAGIDIRDVDFGALGIVVSGTLGIVVSSAVGTGFGALGIVAGGVSGFFYFITTSSFVNE